MRFFAVVLALAVLATHTGFRTATAQTMPSAVVAVMDSQRILRDARAGQSVAKQIKAFIDEFQGVVKREEDALRARQGADNIQIRRHDIIFVPRSTVAEVNLFVEQYVMGIVPLDQAMSFAIADAISGD